jgi:hypothetical protein
MLTLAGAHDRIVILLLVCMPWHVAVCCKHSCEGSCVVTWQRIACVSPTGIVPAGVVRSVSVDRYRI